MKTKIDPWYEHLVEIFQSLYYSLEDLQEKLQSSNDFEEVQRKVINELKHYREKLKHFQGNATKEVRADAFYAITAYTDEVMIYSDYESQTRWEDNTMEDLFFGSHQAGKRVFQKAEELIKHYNDSDIGLAVLYFLCISLKFKGIYRYQESGKPAEVKKELFRLICSTNSSFPRDANQLFPQAYSCTINNRIERRTSKMLLWILCISTVVVTGSIYLSFEGFTPFYLQLNQLQQLAEGLWEERLFLVGLLGITLLVVLLIRLVLFSFSPLSGVIFFRIALRRLFTLLKRNLPPNTKQDLPSYLMMYADCNSTTKSIPDSTSQRRILHSSGIEVTGHHVVETDMDKQLFCGYSLFRQGIVVDLPLQGKSKISRNLLLSYILNRIAKLDTDSQTNGLIIILSCELFLPSNPNNKSAISTLIQDLYAQIRFVQQKSSSNLPVYFIISDCHKLPEFEQFAHTIPEKQRGQIFGWSNPEATVHINLENYVMQGMQCINKRLKEILILLLYSSDEEKTNQGWMRFLKAMTQLEKSLINAFKELFIQAKPVDGENILLRGIYFVGKEQRNLETQQTSFMQSLLQDKIFVETGFARRYSMSTPERLNAFWRNFREEV